MAIIKCDLNDFVIPYLPGFENEFGTQKAETDKSVSTLSMTKDIMRSLAMERPHAVVEGSATTPIEANQCFDIQNSGVTLTLANASFKACKVTVLNSSVGSVLVNFSGVNKSLKSGETLKLIYSDVWKVDKDENESSALFDISEYSYM